MQRSIATSRLRQQHGGGVRGPRVSHRRAGVSLFEVLISLGIFMAAYVALSGLVNSGARSAVKSRLDTMAVMRCESKLAEVTAAIEPLEDVSEQPFEDDQRWTWSLTTATGPHADLLMIQVSVQYTEDTLGGGGSYSMTRLIRDPAVYEAASSTEDEL